MELYQKSLIRSRIRVKDGNPLILTSDNIAEYNTLCAAVEGYNVSSLLLDETHLEFNMPSLYGRDDKRIKIPNKVNITWAVEQIKAKHLEIAYDKDALDNGRRTFTIKRGTGLLSALRHVLNLPDCKLEIGEKKHVTVGTEDVKYTFSLYDFPIKLRKEADALINVFKLKQLAKLHGIKV